ncbi:MAG: ATP-binding cassette domain-containing protein [Bacillota bacterium]
MIEVKEVWHDYEGNGNYAVRDVSFDMSRGEILGFLGPSGAGKSTVQNLMIGLLPLQTSPSFRRRNSAPSKARPRS